jgi:hypothetical protein
MRFSRKHIDTPRSKRRSTPPLAVAPVPEALPPELPEFLAQPAAVPSDLPEELIAARAYEKWQRRGCPEGDGMQDWYAARAELQEERLRFAAPRPGDKDRGI